MNLRAALLAFAFVGALAPLRAANEPAAPDLGNFDRTRQRIEALFRGRDAIPVLPDNLRNPFSRVSNRNSVTSDVEPPGQPVLSDYALLERVAAAVQIRGIVETNGRPALIINRKLFDEGDKLTVLYAGAPVEIVIKRIGAETFTLGYKNSELTMRLPR